MMTNRTRVAASIAAACVVVACATVADLDVEHERERDQDTDDSGVAEDTAGRGVPTLDGGTTADASPDGPPSFRCLAGDIENGRVCCLASDGRSSFFAASCRDAGAQLCASNEECDLGAGEVCTKTTCRDVAISVCIGDAGPGPQCAP